MGSACRIASAVIGKCVRPATSLEGPRSGVHEVSLSSDSPDKEEQTPQSPEEICPQGHDKHKESQQQRGRTIERQTLVHYHTQSLSPSRDYEAHQRDGATPARALKREQNELDQNLAPHII